MFCYEFLTDGPVSASEGEEDEDNEFYDALGEGGGGGGSGNNIANAIPIAYPEGGGESFTLNIPTGGHRRNSSDSSDETDEARETQKVAY